MRTITLPLELITPGLCGGAKPDQQAEIRVPTIRGQLRWWFRVLGGFASDICDVRTQEQALFGGVGDKAKASRLRLALTKPVVSNAAKNTDDLLLQPSDPAAYLIFPLRPLRRDGKVVDPKRRGWMEAGTKFDLRVQWLGDPKDWANVCALLCVLVELGSLGARSRRAMGALALHRDVPGLPTIKDALCRFKEHGKIEVIALGATSSDNAVDVLGNWLKSWRAHGRTVDHAMVLSPNSPHNVGFNWAKKDHDIGITVGSGSVLQNDQMSFRPALGLPILQFFSSGSPSIDWNESFDLSRSREARYKGEGRFASPVLLRPRRVRKPQGTHAWQALIIFANARAWPPQKEAHLSSSGNKNVTVPVSRALYDEMKLARPNSGPFPQSGARPAAEVFAL